MEPTNIINNGLRRCVVKHWQSGSMALRSTAVALDAISEGLRRIMSYPHFWMRNAALDEPSKVQSLVVQAK